MASQTGTRDETYNLISVLYHALQGAETIEQYKNDGGNQEISSFLEELQGQYRQAADRAKQLLGTQLSQGGGQ